MANAISMRSPFERLAFAAETASQLITTQPVSDSHNELDHHQYENLVLQIK